MSEELDQQQWLGPWPRPATFFAARPSRWQRRCAKLWLLFCARRAEPIGARMALALVLLAGAVILLGLALPFAMRGISDDGLFPLFLFGLFALPAAGGAALLATWRARGDLEEWMEDGGALVGLGGREFIWTERGSTLVCAWELVKTYQSPVGLIFALPWRRVCLLPYEALDNPALLTRAPGPA